jgi:hypothetical protein
LLTPVQLVLERYPRVRQGAAAPACCPRLTAAAQMALGLVRAVCAGGRPELDLRVSGWRVRRCACTLPWLRPLITDAARAGWGGSGYSKCAELLGPEFERVFYKDRVAQSTATLSLYMIYGGASPRPGRSSAC